MFNAFFTSWPRVFTFLLEKDHDLNVCKRFPILYKSGQINYYFNLKQFWLCVLSAIVHSLFAFYIPIFAMENASDLQGNCFNNWQVSTISFSVVIITVTLKLLLMSNFWTVINLVSCLFAICFYFIVLFILSSSSFSYQFQNEVKNI